MTGKYEGLEFLYQVCERMGMDNLPMEDLELIKATVYVMEHPQAKKK